MTKFSVRKQRNEAAKKLAKKFQKRKRPRESTSKSFVFLATTLVGLVKKSNGFIKLDANNGRWVWNGLKSWSHLFFGWDEKMKTAEKSATIINVLTTEQIFVG